MRGLITSRSAIGLSIAVCLFATQVQGAMLASDSADDPAYDGGFSGGTNGGTGWGGAWSFSTFGGGSAGGFVFTSTNNGDGDGNGDDDIDTNDEAWGTFANNGGELFAERPFNGALSPGQTFSIDMDNGFINGGSRVAFALMNTPGDFSGTSIEFELRFEGGDDFYEYVDDVGFDNSTGIGFTDEGLSIDFTLTSATTWDLSVTELISGAVSNFSGNTRNGNPIAGLALININAGGGAAFDAYFNSIAITPEPTTAILAFTAAGLLLVRRRRAA